MTGDEGRITDDPEIECVRNYERGGSVGTDRHKGLRGGNRSSWPPHANYLPEANKLTVMRIHLSATMRFQPTIIDKGTPTSGEASLGRQTHPQLYSQSLHQPSS